jgi:plastocyanin
VANVKWYQVMMFSLIFVAIALTGVIAGAHHGVDSAQEHFGPPAASGGAPAGSNGAPAPPPAAGATIIDITAKNLAFDKRSVSAPANTAVTVRFNNQDGGIAHNVAFYKSKTSVTQPLASGSKPDLVTGPQTAQFSFTTPGPGTYYYQCDVHPEMKGSFIVR